MNTVEMQFASDSKNIPDHQKFQYWVDTVLRDDSQNSEVVIRIVDEGEMIEFNEQYREKQGPTNILSFPFEAPDSVESSLLGDLLVCAPILENESELQNKKLEDHWAHMIIHGVLHLVGYDHMDDVEAEVMEALEINILKSININNPYEETNNK